MKYFVICGRRNRSIEPRLTGHRRNPLNFLVLPVPASHRIHQLLRVEADTVFEDDLHVFDIGNLLGRVALEDDQAAFLDRKSTRLNSSHEIPSRMPSSA